MAHDSVQLPNTTFAFDDAIRPGKGRAREPCERRDAGARREIAPKAPKSGAAHGAAACRRQVAAGAISRVVEPVRGSSPFLAYAATKVTE